MSDALLDLYKSEAAIRFFSQWYIQEDSKKLKANHTIQAGWGRAIKANNLDELVNAINFTRVKFERETTDADHSHRGSNMQARTMSQSHDRFNQQNIFDFYNDMAVQQFGLNTNPIFSDYTSLVELDAQNTTATKEIIDDYVKTILSTYDIASLTIPPGSDVKQLGWLVDLKVNIDKSLTILNVPSNTIGLGRTLHIHTGPLPSNRAETAASFIIYSSTIKLPPDSPEDCFSHEWLHALDYFSKNMNAGFSDKPASMSTYPVFESEPFHKTVVAIQRAAQEIVSTKTWEQRANEEKLLTDFFSNAVWRSVLGDAWYALQNEEQERLTDSLNWRSARWSLHEIAKTKEDNEDMRSAVNAVITGMKSDWLHVKPNIATPNFVYQDIESLVARFYDEFKEISNPDKTPTQYWIDACRSDSLRNTVYKKKLTEAISFELAELVYEEVGPQTDSRRRILENIMGSFTPEEFEVVRGVLSSNAEPVRFLPAPESSIYISPG